MSRTARINNWDLVDCSAEHIVGTHLRDGTCTRLLRLAKSEVLRERCIAILTTRPVTEGPRIGASGYGLERLVLIRLFQEAPISSVGTCRARPFREMCTRVSASVRQRRGLPAVPRRLSMAQGVPMPAMCPPACVRHRDAPTLGVRGVPASGVPDGRHDPSQHEDAADAVVLGGIPDDDRQARRVRAVGATGRSSM